MHRLTVENSYSTKLLEIQMTNVCLKHYFNINPIEALDLLRASNKNKVTKRLVCCRGRNLSDERMFNIFYIVAKRFSRATFSVRKKRRALF